MSVKSLRQQSLSSTVRNDDNYESLPESLRSECDEQKYSCCFAVKKLDPKTFARHLENLENNVKEIYSFDCKKMEKIKRKGRGSFFNAIVYNPQFVRNSIKNKHDFCLYQLLLFGVSDRFGYKASIRFNRPDLIPFFFQKNLDADYSAVKITSYSKFNLKREDAIDEEYIDVRTPDRRKPCNELSYAVLTKNIDVVHKIVDCETDEADNDENYEPDHERSRDDETGPIFLAILSGDLKLIRAVDHIPISKSILKSYLKKCSKKQQKLLSSVIEKSSLTYDDDFSDDDTSD
jgi:hypothetical protein